METVPEINQNVIASEIAENNESAVLKEELDDDNDDEYRDEEQTPVRKRKRQKFIEHEDEQEYDSDNNHEDDEEESDDNDAYIDNRQGGSVISISRSGRKVIRPSQWAPNDSKIVTYREEDHVEEIDDDDHSEPTFAAASRKASSRSSYRKKSTPMTFEEYLAKNMSSEAAACQIFCSVCADNSSILNNRIVMCDLCDAPYHQLCHVVPIDNDITEEAALPWFCHLCEKTEKAQRALVIAQEKFARSLERERIKLEKLQKIESIETPPGGSNDATLMGPPAPKRKGPGRPRKNPRPDDEVVVPKKPIAAPKIENKKVVEETRVCRCFACGIRTEKEIIEDNSASELITETKDVANNDKADNVSDLRESTFTGLDAMSIDQLTTGSGIESRLDLVANKDESEVSHLVSATAAPVIEASISRAENAVTKRDPVSFTDIPAVLIGKMCVECQDIFSKQREFLQNQSSELLVSLLFQTSIRYNQLSDFISKQSEKEEPFTNQQLLAYSARSRYVALPTIAAMRVLANPHAATDLYDKRAQRYHRYSDAPTVGVTPILNLTPGESPHADGAQRRKTPHNFGSYEDMIARALMAHQGSRGLKPKDIFMWMEINIPGLPENFRASATQALKKGVDRTRFLRADSGWYQVNLEYQERVKQPPVRTEPPATPVHNPHSQQQQVTAQAQAQANLNANLQAQQIQMMQQQHHHQQQQQMAQAAQQQAMAAAQQQQQLTPTASQGESLEHERHQEHLQNYQIHQANAAAALASMQAQPQPQFQQHMMMHTPQGLMPYPPSAAMAAAFASQPYHPYPGFMQHHLPPPPGFHEQYQSYSTGEQGQGVAENNEDTIFG